jgi:hypothetical protein
MSQPLDRSQLLDAILSKVCRSHYWLKASRIQHIQKYLSEDRVKEHLSGAAIYGVCPIDPGSSTTQVAVLDLDSHHGEVAWEDMVVAASEIASELTIEGLHPIVFRSTGGAGVHIYLMWDSPQDAFTVREKLSTVLTKSGFSCGTGGVAVKEVEIFPKQNGVPADGFGSMFILPFAGESTLLDSFDLEPTDSYKLVFSEPLATRSRDMDAPAQVPTEDTIDIKRALKYIPNCDYQSLDYDEWRNIIFAIHYETKGSYEGLELAKEFSSKSHKYNEEFLENRVWPYIKTYHSGENGAVTGRTILSKAREYGWEESLNDFEIENTETSITENMFQLAELRSQLPVPPDIIAGVIPEAEFGIIYGAPSAGKSFAAIDIAYHLASGEPWRGRKTKQRNVFYVAAEGAGGVRKRTRAYAIHHELAPGVPFYTCEAPINLYIKGGWNAAAKSIEAIQAGLPGVIIIDTLSRSIPGVDENSAKDMSQVIANCQSFSRATSCMVIVVAHSGKDTEKGVRGSSAIRAAADFEISVTRHPDTELRCLKLTKSKDDTDGAQFPFRLTSVEIGTNTDGDAIFSAVAVPSDEAPPIKELAKNLRKDDSMAQLVENTYYLLSESTGDGGVEIEKLIDHVLAVRPNSSPNRRTNVRRFLDGDRKIPHLDVFGSLVRDKNS